MAFSRRLGVVGILGISWFVAIGCGDDDGTKSAPGDGGEAGEAPTGGKTSGGSSSNAGKAGAAAAGEGGTGGVAGGVSEAGMPGGAGETQNGGAGGEEPMGGAPAAGAGGAAAGAGGEGVATGGASGGEGGAPAAVLARCANDCEISDDCIIEGSTTEFVCDETSKHCVDTRQFCEVQDDCVPYSSGWDTPCDSTADCLEGVQACADWQGKGWCAFLSDFCETATTLPEHGGDATEADVCVDQTSGVCDAGICQVNFPCTTSTNCPGGLTGADTCVDGKCGCGSVNSCPNLTAGHTPVCE